jgi:hypothetical protein
MRPADKVDFEAHRCLAGAHRAMIAPINSPDRWHALARRPNHDGAC